MAGFLKDRIVTAARAVVRFPFDLVGRLLARVAQVILAIFVVVLHPQVKYLINLITKSAIVKRYVEPLFKSLLERFYEPYFAYLKSLPPFWATFSIALPLAILEPAKLYATILIAERPRIGIALWLFLQALSFVLIDKTWTAVRPQSRKIWLVSLIHAWIWLNVSYGKHWMRSSYLFQTAVRWKEQAREAARAILSRLSPWRRGQRPL
jgi:hypothetical protein